MPLSPEFSEFYTSWVKKAHAYTDEDVRNCFDKFFTFFVIYNRLYAEATFRLAQTEGSGITIANRDSFPDALAAKEYVANYLGARVLITGLQADQNCVAALETLKDLLREHRFYIKLDLVTGNRQPEEDASLLSKLEESSCAVRAGAILDMIYSIRCNMFHGQKSFHETQLELLQPMTIVLERVCHLLWRKLSST